MPLPDDKVIISVVIDKDVKEVLEKCAAEIDLSVSKFARNLIYIALDDFKLMKKVGIIKLAKTFRTIYRSIKGIEAVKPDEG